MQLGDYSQEVVRNRCVRSHAEGRETSISEQLRVRRGNRRGSRWFVIDTEAECLLTDVLTSMSSMSGRKANSTKLTVMTPESRLSYLITSNRSVSLAVREAHLAQRESGRK